MTDPTVYVVNETVRRDAATGTLVRSMDLTPAAAFGVLRHLLPPGLLFGEVADTVAELREGLAAFTERDYLLPVGSPIAIAAAVAIAAQRTGAPVRLLRWHGREKRYEEVRLDLREPATGTVTDDLLDVWPDAVGGSAVR